MERELSRDVYVESELFPEGTPLKDVPEDRHESLIRTGWTRFRKEKKVKPTQAEPEPDGNPDQGENVESVIQEPEPEPQPEQVSAEEKPPADERPVEVLGLDASLAKLLADAEIATVQDALDHRAANGGFRTIKGIGKASEDQIIAAIESL